MIKMKLCFIWVKDYKGFNNLSLNLSSEIEFEFDHLKNTLKKRKNNNAYTGLFNPRILEITAIVGKNGMGKSNCLELICTLVKGSLHQFNVEFVSVMEDDGKFIISNTLSEKLTTNFEYKKEELKGKTKGLNTIFFSNIYDDRLYGFSREVINATPRNNYGYGMFRGGKERYDLFSSQISFISKHRDSLEKYINLKIPNSIYVEFDIVFSHKRKYMAYNLPAQFRKRLRGMVLHDKKFICTLRYLFLNKLLLEIDMRRIDFDYDSLQFEENESTELFFNRKIDDCLHALNQSHYERDESDFDEDEFIAQINEDWLSLKIIESELDSIKPEPVDIRARRPGSQTYKITYNPDDITIIRSFCNIFGLVRGVNFIWDGISSGSNAFLNLLTVLHDELEGKRNDTLICIDEGDLYLHPAWQIDFINILNKMLPTFFPGKVQLVLTSHSPFLLTDLPRDNVIILHDGKVHDKKVDSLKTFGSNLYELYQNVFFLDGKRFGSLASAHIENVTKKIVKGGLNKEEKVKLDKFIDLIGDKLLHNQLKWMLNND